MVKQLWPRLLVALVLLVLVVAPSAQASSDIYVVSWEDMGSTLRGWTNSGEEIYWGKFQDDKTELIGGGGNYVMLAQSNLFCVYHLEFEEKEDESGLTVRLIPDSIVLPYGD